jgi:MFS family permease
VFPRKQGKIVPDKKANRGLPLWRDAIAVGLLMTATLKIMANATISPALPALEASFAGDPGVAYLTRFLVSAPSLSVVLVAPFAGFAADRFGRGPLLVIGVVLFALAGSAGAYLPDLFSILISRLLLGVAVALTMTAQVALVGDLFAGARRSAFMGWQVAAVNFSGFCRDISQTSISRLSTAGYPAAASGFDIEAGETIKIGFQCPKERGP